MYEDVNCIEVCRTQKRKVFFSMSSLNQPIMMCEGIVVLVVNANVAIFCQKSLTYHFFSDKFVLLFYFFLKSNEILFIF